CLRVLLARGESTEAIDWLDRLATRGIRVVGADFAKAIALFPMGSLAAAAGAAAAGRPRPPPQALLQLIPALVGALDAARRSREAAECLDLLWRLARETPRTYVGLSLVLAELRRFAEALEAIDALLVIVPEDADAQSIRTQLQLRRCATWSPDPTSWEEKFDEAMRAADVVWRVVREPELIERMSPSSTAILGATAARLAEGARALGFADLGARLRPLIAAALTP